MANPTKSLLGYDERKQAHKMRQQGFSYRRIGEVLGVNHSTVIRAIARSIGENTKRAYSANNRESDPGRNGNPIVLNERHNSITAAIFGDPTPERWAFIHGSREAAE